MKSHADRKFTLFTLVGSEKRVGESGGGAKRKENLSQIVFSLIACMVSNQTLPHIPMIHDSGTSLTFFLID